MTDTKSPRQRRRNAGHSARQGKRLEQVPRYWSKDGDGLPGVSEVLSILATGNELKESMGQVVSMPSYIKPIYFTRAALTGTVVHTAIESHVDASAPMKIDAMTVQASAAMVLHNANRRGEMDPNDIAAQSLKARHAFENWLRWAEGQTFTPHSVEARIIDEGLRVGMTADLVETGGDALTVTDWKTTAAESRGHLKPALVTKYRLQAGAYAGLLGRHSGKRVASARLVFCPKHKGRDVFVIELDRDELGRQWRTFEHVLATYHALKGEQS